ncbi:MAG: hypothetical protein E6H83_05345 [Chloroflexi bacterium]|nr:MAG: hypothetical protein E6H83_05345 [Chloroflexota bacterium]
MLRAIAPHIEEHFHTGDSVVGEIAVDPLGISRRQALHVLAVGLAALARCPGAGNPIAWAGDES